MKLLLILCSLRSRAIVALHSLSGPRRKSKALAFRARRTVSSYAPLLFWRIRGSAAAGHIEMASSGRSFFPGGGGHRLSWLRCKPRSFRSCAPSSRHGSHRSLFLHGPVCRRRARLLNWTRAPRLGVLRCGHSHAHRRVVARHRATRTPACS
jgi:hypothetical protein